MRIRMSDKAFQLAVIVLTLLGLLWATYWLPSILVVLGVKKWQADLTMPAVFGLLYLAIRMWPGLPYSYCDLVRGALKRIGCDFERRK